MARIRTLKPELWLSAQVMNLEHSSRLLFLGLITQADDEGRGSADPRRLKASIFGGDDVTSTDVRRWLDEVARQGLCIVYHDEAHGLLYQLPSWSQHQSIDRPRKSAYPPPSKEEVDRRTLVESASTPREGSDRTVPDRKEGNGPDLRTGPDLTVPPRARAREDEVHVAFQKLKSAYPLFAGRQNWIVAEQHYRNRLDAGVTAEDLQAAVERYAAYCAAGGVSTTAHVLRPDTFLGAADDPWKQPWTLPEARARAKATQPKFVAPPDEPGEAVSA